MGRHSGSSFSPRPRRAGHQGQAANRQAGEKQSAGNQRGHRQPADISDPNLAGQASKERAPTALDPQGLAFLNDGLARILGAPPPKTLVEGLLRYLRELELWNPKLGLVEASGHELIIKHVLDCYAAWPLVRDLLGSRWPLVSPSLSQDTSATQESSTREPIRIADLGSGAGLPGLILAIAANSESVPLAVSLVDKQLRRCRFLETAAALQRFDRLSVEVVQNDIGALEASSYMLVTARAFTPLTPESLAQMTRLVSPGGWLVLYKGTAARIRDELRLCGLATAPQGKVVPTNQTSLQALEARVYPLRVPFLEEERHLVLIQVGVPQ